MRDTTALLTEPGLIQWGERVGREGLPPLVLALRGDLGAGKSTLARAVARGAGIEGPVPSPTYNLLFHYDAPRGVRLVHLDLYRLHDPEEVWDLGWAELPEDDQILMIEWPQRAEALLPEPRWDLYIDEITDPSVRRIGLIAVGTPHALPPFPVVESEDVR
ncbi:tRNA (adenosine(37)-N6)-threonylcarbamoyltransferase complex ATPase subunit type 1 TsaE [soil metagenome]